MSTSCPVTVAGCQPIVVLSSQSPNRLNLIRQIGIAHPIVHVSNFEENLPKSLPVREFVEQTARGKLLTILEDMRNKQLRDMSSVILVEGEIIGKPEDAADAVATLKRLHNKVHGVYSGVALAFADGSEQLFSEETLVHFGDYPDRLIDDYVASGEPMNLAGSCAIHLRGAVFVDHIEGCFSNVVGLPIYRVHSALVNKGIL